MNCCSSQGWCFVHIAGDNTLLYDMELHTSWTV